MVFFYGFHPEDLIERPGSVPEIEGRSVSRRLLIQSGVKSGFSSVIVVFFSHSRKQFCFKLAVLVSLWECIGLADLPECFHGSCHMIVLSPLEGVQVSPVLAGCFGVVVHQRSINDGRSEGPGKQNACVSV